MKKKILFIFSSFLLFSLFTSQEVFAYNYEKDYGLVASSTYLLFNGTYTTTSVAYQINWATSSNNPQVSVNNCSSGGSIADGIPLNFWIDGLFLNCGDVGTWETVLWSDNFGATSSTVYYVQIYHTSTSTWTTDWERDCPSFTNIYDCFNASGTMYAYCEWNYASSTCEYPDSDYTDYNECGPDENCQFCETESECNTYAGSCGWKSEWPDFWNEYCYDLPATSSWIGTITEEDYSSSSAGQTLLDITEDPGGWIKTKIQNLNPVRHAPYSWIYQGVSAIQDEIDNQTHSTSTAEFAAATNFCFNTFSENNWSTSTEATSCVQMFPVNEIENISFFSWARTLFGGILYLGFFFYVFKIGGNWIRKHSNAS